MTKTTLSKSQYAKALQCPLSLWLYRFRKDLTPEVSEDDQKRFEVGEEIGKLAQQYFSGGVEVTHKQIDMAVECTNELIAEGEEIVYEATAIHPKTGCYARADILRKIPDTDEWDIIEVKSSTSVKSKPQYYDDLAFQYYVFTGAGYKINDCFLMHLNNQYTRCGDIEVESLFCLEDLTKDVVNMQANVEMHVPTFLQILNLENEPKTDIGLQCGKPYTCGYKKHCWRHVPNYSTFNVFNRSKQRAVDIYKETGSYDVAQIPVNMYPTSQNAKKDLMAYKRDVTLVEAGAIASFLDDFVYPLYYLDYETFSSAVPLFDHSKPYQQIPFQFSLHVQHVQGGEVEHFEFIHQEQTDPREAFTKALIEYCPGEGSVIVWNQGFEKRINRELSIDLPDYKKQLQAINDRMIDLADLFSKRWLYNPAQNGSYSIKAVLPAFTEISYKDMDISNGGTASMRYEDFIKDGVVSEDLWKALSSYCELDTYAMVEIERVLREKSSYSSS